jgi:catechol 2,3-dioxygenase-like lactoylglutathione lyase family enzyme
MIQGMDVLGSRILLHASSPERSQRFYRDTLGLAVYRQYGTPASPGLIFFLGGGYLEVTGASRGSAGSVGSVGDGADRPLSLWLQVRDVQAEYERLKAAGVAILQQPRREPWGLDEMWIVDPDGVAIVLVQVPPEHPLRTDSRSL